jgi:uncharacterized protein YidB (DUF937 family)
MTDTLFDPSLAPPPPQDLPKSFRDELVGDGKKFKTDEDLARGKWESDVHIKRLEAEMADLRKSAATQARLQELVDKLTIAGAPPINPPEPKDDEKNKGVAPEQLEAVLDKRLQKYEAERTGKDNRVVVRQELQKHLGPNFVTKLKERAAELELGENFLDSLAASNPKAFLKLLGVGETTQAPAETLFTPPRSSINTSSSQRGSDKKDFKYYQNLKRENAKAWTPQVQIEMHEQATKLGPAFYTDSA